MAAQLGRLNFYTGSSYKSKGVFFLINRVAHNSVLVHVCTMYVHDCIYLVSYPLHNLCLHMRERREPMSRGVRTQWHIPANEINYKLHTCIWIHVTIG